MALVHRGLAPISLLETYNQERLPVIAEMLQQVTGIMEKETSNAELKAGAMVRGKNLFMLGINYRWSPIILDQRSNSSVNTDLLKANAYLGWEDLCAGDRAPSVPGLASPGSVETETTLFDILTPARHTVLIFAEADDNNKATSLVQAISRSYPYGLIQTVILSKQPENVTAAVDYRFTLRDDQARTSYSVEHDQFSVVIIRPDGYIGGMVNDTAGLFKYFSLIFKS